MDQDIKQFNETLWDYYNTHGRHDLPWRQPDALSEPYKILVSEIMLQQTQVSRVLVKFHEFLIKFPSVDQLAKASLSEVIVAWSGLGYNRRAKFLWQAAQKITADLKGQFPSSLADLVTLPGVGKNTAGAILAYAFNQPAIFIETNIRTVYIHHFFNEKLEVTDAEIIEMLELTLDHEHPREFYWALMDYGSYLKQTVGNVGKHSVSYTKQSKFEGSKRQVRGQVLRALATTPQTLGDLKSTITDERLVDVLHDLVNENLINKSGNTYRL